MFEADEHMLSVGKGDIDDYTVMTAGNIQRFPKRESQSASMVCDESSVTNSTTNFSMSGHIVIQEGNPDNEEVNTGFTMSFDVEDEHRIKFKAEAPEAYSSDN